MNDSVIADAANLDILDGFETSTAVALVVTPPAPVTPRRARWSSGAAA